MKYTQEEILNALRILKEICVEYDDECKKCPFGDKEGDCLLYEFSPSEYNLNEEGVCVWKALI